MSEPQNEDKAQGGFSAFWNKPLKMTQKEIDRYKKKGKEVKQKTVGSEIISWIMTLAVAVVLALVIRAFFFELYGVEGASMTNTLHDGERMFCTKLDYLTGGPQRGDVVICHYPNRGDTAFVKRLVALPGDTVEISAGQLYVNGEAIAYPENMNLSPRPGTPAYTNAERVLGEDEYFVLGDNRGNSNDSSYIGPIPRSMILAHVRTVIWPLNKIRGIPNEFTVVKE